MKENVMSHFKAWGRGGRKETSYNVDSGEN